MTMARIGSRLAKLIERFISVQAAIACVFMLFITGIIVHGVAMRYILRDPQAYSVEFARYSLMPLTAFALAYTQKLRGHVRVEILIMHFSTKLQRVFEIISHIAFLLFASGLLCAACLLTLTFISEHMTSDEAAFPLWIVGGCMVLGLFALCLQLMIDICTNTGEPKKKA